MDIDWSNCPLVTPEPEGGDWLVMRSAPRLGVEVLVVNYNDGESIETLAYMFECPIDDVRAIIDYATERRLIPDLTDIRTTRDFDTEQGVLPAGTLGTIVSAYDHGGVYLVEFEAPWHVVSVPLDLVLALHG
jgi:uncharacterized protein (DUF433 family)